MNSTLSKALQIMGEEAGTFNQILVNMAGTDGERWKKELRKFARGETCWPKVQVTTPTKKNRKNSSSIIYVDRTVAPVYSLSVKEVIHPELEKAGPEEFDVLKLERWLHEEQKGNKSIGGLNLYEHIKTQNMLESCLNFRDLEEIKKRGTKFFREHFNRQEIYAWKSVARDEDNSLIVPCLYETSDIVVFRLRQLRLLCGDANPVLRFPNKK